MTKGSSWKEYGELYRQDAEGQLVKGSWPSEASAADLPLGGVAVSHTALNALVDCLCWNDTSFDNGLPCIDDIDIWLSHTCVSLQLAAQ